MRSSDGQSERIEDGCNPTFVTIDLPNRKMENDIIAQSLGKRPLLPVKLGNKQSHKFITLLLLTIISVSGLIGMLKPTYNNERFDYQPHLEALNSLTNFSILNGTIKVFY